jgi:hypothetical protein
LIFASNSGLGNVLALSDNGAVLKISLTAMPVEVVGHYQSNDG